MLVDTAPILVFMLFWLLVALVLIVSGSSEIELVEAAPTNDVHSVLADGGAGAERVLFLRTRAG